MKVRVRNGRLREVALAVQLARRALLTSLAHRRGLTPAEQREADNLDDRTYMRIWRGSVPAAERRHA